MPAERAACIAASVPGYSDPMASDNGELAVPDSTVAGHLVALLGDRDMAGLTAELSALVRTPETGSPRRSRYPGVLSWLVTAIAEVVTARLGAPDAGEVFVVEVRTTAGTRVSVEDLPDSGGRVVRSVESLLSGDRAGAHAELAAAAREPIPSTRAETLVEALVLLDALLNANLAGFPDPPPE